MTKAAKKEVTKDLKTAPKNQKIYDYLIANTQYLSSGYEDVAVMFDTSYETVRHIARRLRTKVKYSPTAEFKITDEVIARKENALIKSLKNQLEQAVKDYEQISDMYDAALALKTDNASIKVPKITGSKGVKNEASAIIQISDGHFGQIINPSTVNGLNKYNPEIAEERVKKLAENTIKLIRKERNDTNLDTLTLILGGDFLENSQLHQHSEMTTSMSPMEETLFARKLLAYYLNFVADHGGFKKIIVSCTRGNHSRITKKMNASVDYRMNYETILYNILKQDFDGDLFEWHIPDSEVAEFSVFDYNLRVIHGHQVKYQGGVGGLSVPLNKYILRMDQIKKAYYTFVHHYHALSYPTVNSTINGSIVGYAPYAMSLGCSYERPMQSFQIIDKERGMTIRTPIFAD